MASKKKKEPIKAANNELRKVIFGLLFLFIFVLLLTGLVSYMFSWQSDQSLLSSFTNRQEQPENVVSKFGNFLGHILIYRGFGIATFVVVFLLGLSAIKLLLDTRMQLLNRWFWGTLWMIFVSVAFGFFNGEATILGGMCGYEINRFIQDYIGALGTGLLLFTLLCMYSVWKFAITPEKIRKAMDNSSEVLSNPKEFLKKLKSAKEIIPFEENPSEEIIKKEEIKKEKVEEELPIEEVLVTEPLAVKKEPLSLDIQVQEPEKEVPNAQNFEVQIKREEEIDPQILAQQMVENFGEYDPTLELKNFQFPPIELLKEYPNTSVVRDDAELNENKNTIIQTLKNYKIEIVKISAIIGPTVTLYEIVPAPGIKISHIKNLEDDIALSLKALGIRIIAPIPGKGTVGIEVPNKKPSMVSMRSVISSPRFQSAEMELPIAFGKTITNETYVVDLAKMPHLLMAGATGQGKSVGLNAVLTSLLYKKHPAEVKFVLVDPKRVELSIYNKIERHYLAKLPDSEGAIITDNTKVINTLNSLCIEMENRLGLLESAMVRNIKEYNAKFKARLLNPNEGHQYLPYIVLVVDEFADLIMTAGKEVEKPIARLAQLARAIGIHLIIATQRPSVNVITGIIKANFPARVAFRVIAKIDSKTILDGSGADQLIGKGDMLYTDGSGIVRIQCAFVDTPEVERIVEFIGAQKAYPSAFLLPEYVGEGSGEALEFDPSERDSLFRDAAEIVVNSQQGSASTLQRKLKLGYNRAGRLIDQLEAAGIVGPFKGSKAREVLIPDIVALEQYFRDNNL